MDKSGGVIGNILTGALATCYMIVWTRKFKEAIERVMVNLTGYLLLLLMIYVDNGNMAARALPLGSRLIKDWKRQKYQQTVSCCSVAGCCYKLRYMSFQISDDCWHFRGRISIYTISSHAVSSKYEPIQLKYLVLSTVKNRRKFLLFLFSLLWH